MLLRLLAAFSRRPGVEAYANVDVCCRGCNGNNCSSDENRSAALERAERMGGIDPALFAADLLRLGFHLFSGFEKIKAREQNQKSKGAVNYYPGSKQ